MSYKWRRVDSYKSKVYSFKKLLKNNYTMRYAAVGSINFNRDVFFTSRFRLQRLNTDSSVSNFFAHSDILVKDATPKKVGTSLEPVVHSNKVGPPSSPISKSRFSYRNQCRFSNKYKLAKPLKLNSERLHVFCKPLRKGFNSLVNPYRLSVKRAINLSRRMVRMICPDYVIRGSCEYGESCPLRHNVNYLRICPKFLQNICLHGEQKCPLAHVLDPCRLPRCVYYAKGVCNRSCCRFLHIRYSDGTPVCQDFLIGRCENGPECEKRHVWRGELESNHKDNSCSVEKAYAKADSNFKKFDHLGSLRAADCIPDFIPFDIMDE